MFKIKYCGFALVIVMLCTFVVANVHFTYAQKTKTEGATKGNNNNNQTNKKDPPPQPAEKKNPGNAGGNELNKNNGGGGDNNNVNGVVKNGGVNQNTQEVIKAGGYPVAITDNRVAANALAAALNNGNGCCRVEDGATAIVISNNDGTVSVQIRPNSTGGGGNNNGGPGGGGGGNPFSNCVVGTQNLTTVDTFFVPAGTQPATFTPINTVIGQWTSASGRQMIQERDAPQNQIARTNFQPYQSTMLAANQLEVGKSYEPVIAVRRTYSCLNNNGGQGGGPARRYVPYQAPGYFHTQLPFGSNGSFPVRARIDVGNNGTPDWTEYQNNILVPENQTVYAKLPAFTTNEVGTHSLTIVSDIRHTIDPNRTCFAPTVPASADWGCLRESNERDNDRTETFTTTGASTTPLRVAVQNIQVNAGSRVSAIPFSITNLGIQTATSTNYIIRIAGTQVGSGTYGTSIAPQITANISGAVSYTAPARATTVPLEVCARVGTTAALECAQAVITVVAYQCSDTLDNDSDSFSDRNDIGCYTDPTDPTTFDPTDPTEGGLASSTLITSMSLTPAVPVVRFGGTATLRYRIASPFAVRCTITGGATNQSFVHTAPVSAGEIATSPLESTQNFTMSCTPSPILGNPFPAQTTGAKVEVVPRVQEV